MNTLKDKLNIIFSLGVMLLTGSAIVKSSLSDHETFHGYIEEVSCQADRKRAGIYSYQIRLANDVSFRNRLDVGCESVSKLKQGDLIKVESKGHIFIQVTHNGIEVFNKQLLEVKRSGANIVFILLFILASCDVVYRLYYLKK